MDNLHKVLNIAITRYRSVEGELRQAEKACAGKGSNINDEARLRAKLQGMIEKCDVDIIRIIGMITGSEHLYNTAFRSKRVSFLELDSHGLMK